MSGFHARYLECNIKHIYLQKVYPLGLPSQPKEIYHYYFFTYNATRNRSDINMIKVRYHRLQRTSKKLHINMTYKICCSIIWLGTGSKMPNFFLQSYRPFHMQRNIPGHFSKKKTNNKKMVLSGTFLLAWNAEPYPSLRKHKWGLTRLVGRIPPPPRHTHFLVRPSVAP